MAIKVIILIVMVALFLFEVFKHRLTTRQRRLPLPENVRDVYDQDQYEKWTRYSTETNRLSLMEDGAKFVLGFLLLAFNAHAWLSGRLSEGVWGNSIQLVLVDMLIFLPFGILFNWLQQMRVEEKYGFNRTSKKTFVADQVKQTLIGAGLTSAIMVLYILFYQKLGLWGFVLLFAALAVLITLVSMFSLTISKLFNKFEPLPEGALRSDLEALFAKHGYTLRNIYVMNASKRTSKSNAFCAGLGKKKDIALFDNLVNNYTPQEITAVFAHELAHYHYRDTAWLTAANMLTFVPMVALLLVLTALPAFCQALGFAGSHFGMAFLLMGTLMQAVMIPVSIPLMAYVRRCEYRADAFAAENGYAEALISALKRLNSDSLSNLNPHPLIVKLEHSHPTLSQRIAALSDKGGQ